MKTIFSYILFFCFLFLSACTGKNEISPLLLDVERLLENDPDSALLILESIHLEEVNQYNQAYYYLLLVEAKNKNEESLLSDDLHLDWILEHINDKDLVAKAIIYKGKIWSELNELGEAVVWYQKAIDLLEEKESNYKILSDVYIDLGKIFINQCLYDEAMVIFQKVYSLNKNKVNKKFVALSLRNIGWTHFYINNKDSVYYYLQEALVYAKQDKDSLPLSEQIYNDLAAYYEEIEDYDAALQQLQNITKPKDNTYLNMGSMFLNIQQYDSARHYLLLGAESDYIYTKVASYIYLEKLENSLDDYKNAHYYSILYNELKDSIELKTRAFDIKTIDIKYNTEKTVTKLEKQHKNRNRIISFAFPLSLIIIVSIFVVRDKKKKVKHKKQEKELLLKEKELLLKEKELMALNTKKIEQENLSQNEQDSIKLNHYQKQIKKNKAELTLLLNLIINLQCEIFKKTKIFARILELNQQKGDEKSKDILNNKEQEVLKQEINNIFGTVINNLRKNYPTLTNEDLLYCCLHLLKLPNLTISMCFGASNTNKTKQRKFRIKEKINRLDNSFLFDFIFSNPESPNNVTKENATD